MPLRYAAYLGILVATSLAAQIIELEQVVNGLNDPTDVTHAGDARLFVTERAGTIRILGTDGKLAAQPFLNITNRVLSTGSEQGVLGLAFHPQYTTNGFFYVYYVTGSGNGTLRLSRFHVTANPMVADPESELILWTLAKPTSGSFGNHNGGDVAFGPDGYLYFAPGDGGDGGDPGNRAQNMALAFGKVLRINVDSGSPYSIPSTNPFATSNTVMREIWASGLRNPFRFSFDRLTGDMWLGDVGQAVIEEVNFFAAGTNNGPNLGWRCYEGNNTYNTDGCAAIGTYKFPVKTHTHGEGWCSVIGGVVYRGSRYPNLQGRYIYSDYCAGRLESLKPNGSGGWTHEELTTTGTFGLASFGEDASGELYAVNTENGRLYRIIDPSAIVRVSPKVFLDGPFNSTTSRMSDGMRAAGLVPSTEPYTAAGFAQVAKGGGEVAGTGLLTTTGDNAIVDWVRVELRSSANPQLVAATRQALLQRDGDIIAADGSASIAFTVGAGNYHVAVRHRNHLGVMTAATVALTATSTTVDLRNSTTATYGTNARKEVGPQRLLWCGDVNGNGTLAYTGAGNDRDPILVAIGGSIPTNTQTGYRMEDVNLDGVVKYTGALNDRDPILTNIGGTVPTARRDQQLP